MPRRRVAPLPLPPPDFVGRVEERRRVERLWPTSRLVAIVGPGGIGKTALARWVADHLARGKTAWAATPSRGFLDAAEAALGLEPLPTGTSDRVLRLAEKLDRRSLVLCVDDLHTLGPADHTAIRATAGHLRRGKLLVTSRAPVELGELTSASVVIELGPLSLEESATLVQQLLERLGRSGDVEQLAQASAGSPQWCGLLAGGGRVGDRIADVLATTSPPERDALALLAVACNPCETARFDVDPAVIASLEARFLIERASAREVGLHDLVRETVLASLDRGERAGLARRAAAACRDAGDVAGWLQHLEDAGDRQGMADALAAGADAWLASQLRGAEVLRLTSWAEEGGATIPLRLELRRALSFLSLGRNADAQRSFARAGDGPGEPVLRAAVEVRVLRERGAGVVERRRAIAEGLERDTPAASPSDRGDLLLGWVWECMHTGDWDAAIAACRSAVSGERAVDPLSAARAARILGELLLERGDADGAAAALVDAEARATRLGSASIRAFVEGTWVQLHVRHGTLAEAKRRLARMEAIPIPPQDARLHASRAFRRAEVLARAGRAVEAMHVLEACETDHPVLAIGLRCALWSLLAAIATDAGEHERAGRAARALLAVPRAQRPWHYGVEAAAALAAAELSRGRIAAARRRAIVAAAAAARAGLWERAARAVLMRAEVERQAGDAGLAVLLAEATGRAASLAGAAVLEARSAIAGAHALRALGRSGAARDAAAAALGAAEASGQTLLAAHARILLGLCAVDRGELPAAAAALDRARQDAGEPRAPGLLAEERRLAAAIAAAPGDHDLWMDARTAQVVIDGRRGLDLSARPLLARLLRCVLERDGQPLDKDALFATVWQLPYGPTRDATLYKAVARLARELDPDDPRRFLRWDADARLTLAALRPHLVR